MSTFVDGDFLNERNQKLYYSAWKAAEPRAILIFHHGYGSHSQAYPPEFKRIADAGISFFAFDAHSFGRSVDGPRSLVSNFEHMVEDLYTFRKKIVDAAQPNVAVPVFLSGLSMGGMIAICSAIKDQAQWQGLILLSPAVDVPRNFINRILAAVQGILVKIAPTARVVPEPQIPNVTFNETERKKLQEDEFFDKGKVRIQTGAMFLNAWNYIAKHEHTLTLPILIHYSSIDKVVYPPATERFAKSVASKDITVKPFDKYAHDLYMDESKEESCPLVIEWILSHISSASTAAASQPSVQEGASRL